MEEINEEKYPFVRKESNKKKIVLPGYPTYPDDEDIYQQGKEEKEIDPEKITIMMENEEVGKNNKKDYTDIEIAEELDVPGSELDDIQEEIGSEDEENNYYSLSDEDQEDLDK